MATLEVMPAPETVATAGKLEIIANRRELLAELEAVIGVVERKTTIPILANLLLVADPSGAVTVTATDLDQSIRTSFHAKVKEAGAVTVPARKLFDYVKLLSGDDVTIRQDDNNWLQIKCGRSKTKMVGMGAANFPEIPDAPAGETALPAPMLKAFIEKATISISEEESRYTLNGALLILGDRSMEMVSTDGHRLTKVHQATDDRRDAVRRLLIPRKALSELLSLLKSYSGDSVWLFEDHNHIHFGVGVRRLTSRKIAGQFPNYEAIFPKADGPGLVLDVPTVAESLNRCLLFSENDTRAVGLSIGENSLDIECAARDLGQSREDIEIHGGPSATLRIGFNGDYIRELLQIITGSVQVHLKDGNSAALFTWRTDEGLTLSYVVMPMRLGGK